ncbi:MAG TPA: 3-oxoacyl-ACP synthase [Cyanobacteria bacterium UBA9971]|nr:3-oxoacyl-ACP synthase [Cyanobacteria bacterium UBA9971]
MMNSRYPVTITGVGKCLPENVITNDDLTKLVDTNDEWIFSRSGIKERHVVSGNETASSLAAKAAKDAIEFSGVDVKDIDLIICATSLPDNLYPSTACEVQLALGASNAAAFDIVAACSGLIYGLKIANSFIASGEYKNVLLVGVDIHSRFVNWSDRSTCVLFGDGAGALVVQRSQDGQNDVLSVDIRADGTKASELKIPLTGINCPLVEQNTPELQCVNMNGREIYKFAVNYVPESIMYVLKNINLTVNDVDTYILHQANIRIIQAIADKLHENQEKFYVNLHKYGNTSSASIAIALTDAIEENKINYPSTLVLSGFGAGLTWGTAVVRWRAKDKRKNV